MHRALLLYRSLAEETMDKSLQTVLYAWYPLYIFKCIQLYVQTINNSRNNKHVRCQFFSFAFCSPRNDSRIYCLVIRRRSRMTLHVSCRLLRISITPNSDFAVTSVGVKITPNLTVTLCKNAAFQQSILLQLRSAPYHWYLSRK